MHSADCRMSFYCDVFFTFWVNEDNLANLSLLIQIDLYLYDINVSISVPECIGDLVYNECGSACPLICDEEQAEVCTADCVPGCTCPEGLYRVSRNDTRCIPAENCTTAGE